jgi:hypothetical protein
MRQFASALILFQNGAGDSGFREMRTPIGWRRNGNFFLKPVLVRRACCSGALYVAPIQFRFHASVTDRRHGVLPGNIEVLEN